MTPLRIVHLITDLNIGGAEVMLARIAAGADRGRFHMRVVSMIPPGPVGAQLAAQGIEVRSLRMARAVPDPRGLVRLVAMLRREPADLLQTWLYHADLLGLAAARLARVPRLVWNVRCSDMEFDRYSRLSAALPRILARFSRWPDAVLVNSEAGRVAHERLGYRPRRWQLIPNGVETDRFWPDPAARARLRAELGLPTDAFVICLPARFDPMKDHATFLAAAQHFAERHREARFLLVGRGNDGANPALRTLLQKIACAAQILLLGERQDMPAIFAASDVATLSSRFGEGFPNVLAEAMACAVPVVTTDVGDSARVVAGAGSVVPLGDAAGIAAAWEALAALGREGRAEQGELARRRIADSYALPAIVARYEAFYAELTRDEPRHASQLLDGTAGR